MSKNRNQRLLDELFADIEQDNYTLPDSSEKNPDGWTWECDRLGRFMACSPEVEQILGISPEAFLGQSLARFALDDDSPEQLAARLKEKRFPVEVNISYRHANGSRLPVSLWVIPTYTAEGEQAGWHGFAVLQEQPALQPFQDTAPAGEQEESPMEADLPSSLSEDEVQAMEPEIAAGSITMEPESPATSPGSPEDLWKSARAMILDLLQEVKDTAATVTSAPFSRITISEKKEQRNGYPSLSNTSREEFQWKSDDRWVVSFEHKLEWGTKFRLTDEEKDFIQKYRYRPSGVSGYLRQALASKEIVKCDVKWVSVVLTVTSDDMYVWIKYSQADAEANRVYVQEFVANPRQIIPTLEFALDNAWINREVLQAGVDYFLPK